MSVFKGYDVRGIWGEELNEEIGRRFGHAISMFGEEIYIGRDVRRSSEPFFKSLVEGVCKKVYSLELSTTPIVQFFSLKGLGVMITASHNPPEYNGLKVFLKGKPATEMLREFFEKSTPRVCDPDYEIIEKREYFDEIEKRFSFDKKYRIIFDPGNGSGCFLIEFMKKYFDLKSVNDFPDGNFPSHLPDPTKDENLRDVEKFIKDFDFGVLFDGDCDRIRVIFKDRKPWADFIAYVLMKDAKKVVFEVTMPVILERKAEELGVKVYRSKTGYINCQKVAEEKGADFYGEYSGHFAFKEFYYIGDSLYTLLKFSELFDWEDLEEYPEVQQKRLDVRCENPKKAVERLKEILDLEFFDECYFLDGLDLRKDDYRILVRDSRTEPMLRIKFEGNVKEAEKVFKERIMPKIKEIQG